MSLRTPFGSFHVHFWMPREQESTLGCPYQRGFSALTWSKNISLKVGFLNSRAKANKLFKPLEKRPNGLYSPWLIHNRTKPQSTKRTSKRDTLHFWTTTSTIFWKISSSARKNALVLAWSQVLEMIRPFHIHTDSPMVYRLPTSDSWFVPPPSSCIFNSL